MSDAGVVLAGGRSARMGRDKAELAWGATTMLGAVLAALGAALEGPLVVVGPHGRPRPLPTLPLALAARVRSVHDPEAGHGPLQGLATGLSAAADAGAARAFVASVDLPLLHPAYVRRVLALLEAGADVALPVVGGHRQPLAAAYTTALGARATTLLAAGHRRPGELFATVRVVEVGAAALLADPALAAADPELRSVHDVDTPDELDALLARPDDATPDPGA